MPLLIRIFPLFVHNVATCCGDCVIIAYLLTLYILKTTGYEKTIPSKSSISFFMDVDIHYTRCFCSVRKFRQYRRFQRNGAYIHVRMVSGSGILLQLYFPHRPVSILPKEQICHIQYSPRRAVGVDNVRMGKDGF